MLPYIEIGVFKFPSYLFMAALAFFASSLLIVLRRKTQNISAWEAIALSCTTLIGGALGAKIFHIVGRIMKGEVNGQFWTAQFWRNFRLTGGFIWYGGVIGALLFLLIYVFAGYAASTNPEKARWVGVETHRWASPSAEPQGVTL